MEINVLISGKFGALVHDLCHAPDVSGGPANLSPTIIEQLYRPTYLLRSFRQQLRYTLLGGHFLLAYPSAKRRRHSNVGKGRSGKTA